MATEVTANPDANQAGETSEVPLLDTSSVAVGSGEEERIAVIPLDAAIQSHRRQATTRVLPSLTAREARLLRTRFGT